MDFGPTFRFWSRGKNGCFSVPTLRIGSVVGQGHFFGDPDYLTEFHPKKLKNKGIFPSESPTAQDRQNFVDISEKVGLHKKLKKANSIFFSISVFGR